MKIDKRNPKHWLYLGLFALNVGIAISLRPFTRRPHRTKITLYGHKLSGNLLALYRELRSQEEFEVVFLTLDPDYYRELVQDGESCRLATSLSCVRWLIDTNAVISDHGLHSMVGLLIFSDVKFFDVWHAIPFKGFDSQDFEVQRRYDEVWVASPLLATVYRTRYGFEEGKVAVTGYARTDRLIRDLNLPRVQVMRQLGLPESTNRMVLFAPTWKQDSASRELLPFGVNEVDFYATLSGLAVRHNATIAIRTHLNSPPQDGPLARYAGLIALPYASFPDTEAILLATDVLICDWSSIAFDFLLTNRPTIFLDVPAPFRKGFSLGPEYRFGAIAGDMGQLSEILSRYLENPEKYDEECGAIAASVRSAVYGDFADGNATPRCVARLRNALSE